MPLEVKRVVGSFSGTNGADGISACPRALKNSIYFFRKSADLISFDYIIKTTENLTFLRKIFEEAFADAGGGFAAVLLNFFYVGKSAVQFS
jgi:hypothetical protein